MPTVHEYDLIASWYAGERGTHSADGTGVPEALALAATLAPGSRILDIGCGNGLPITRALLDAGHRIVGVDTSREMLSRFRRNLPTTVAVRASAQWLPFLEASFDAAHAWGVMFHLPLPEQRAAMAAVSRLLKPGAPWLFTAGDADGTDSDAPKETPMNGVVFRYYAMSTNNYRLALERYGMTLENVTHDAGHNGYFLARKRSSDLMI